MVSVIPVVGTRAGGGKEALVDARLDPQHLTADLSSKSPHRPMWDPVFIHLDIVRADGVRVVAIHRVDNRIRRVA